MVSARFFSELFDAVVGGEQLMYVWSSSEYGSNYAVYVNSGGVVASNGKDTQFGVVPALEIPA